MSIRVVSLRKGGTKALPGERIVDITHPSIFGNPFQLSHESQRDQILKQYTKWLTEQWHAKGDLQKAIINLAADSKNGEKIALQCWCAPKPCHGDILKLTIDELVGDSKSWS